MVTDAIEKHVSETSLLGRLLQSTKSEAGLTKREVRDNLVVFLLAAYETPSIGWVLYFLGKHPDMAARLTQEVDDVLCEGVASLHDLPRLVYTEACIKEALRLVPPSPILAREALGDDTLSAGNVKRGTLLVIPAYAIHQNANKWLAPTAFRPERFLESSAAAASDFLPFGRGARQCIGAGLAMQTKVTMVAMLLWRFSFSLVPGYHATPHNKLRPFPSGGLPTRLAVRRTANA